MPDLQDEIWCYEELDRAGRARVEKAIRENEVYRKLFDEARQFRNTLSHAIGAANPDLEELVAFLLATLFFSPETEEKKAQMWDDLELRSRSDPHLSVITKLYLQRLLELVKDRDSSLFFESLADETDTSNDAPAGE